MSQRCFILLALCLLCAPRADAQSYPVAQPVRATALQRMFGVNSNSPEISSEPPASSTPDAATAAALQAPGNFATERPASTAPMGETVAPSADWANLASAHEAAAYPYVGWARMESMLWWIKNGPAPPPLATTGPATSVQPGGLGQPGTQILIGGTPLNYSAFAGGRWSLGMWCEPEREFGFEVTGFVLENRTIIASAQADLNGNPILARPFIDAQTNLPQVAFVTFPDRFSGGVDVDSASQLWGVDANVLCNVLQGNLPFTDRLPGIWRVDALAGFRLLELRENLNVDEVANLLPAGVANFVGNTIVAPNTLLLHDGFNARNHFYGMQAGARVEWIYGAWFVDFTGKLALGATSETVEVQGNTTLVNVATATGGLLATSTNIGHSGRTTFAVVPEMGLNIGYQCNPFVRVFTGYNFMYWSRVVRPGNQIDTTVNLTQVPIHPSFGPLVGPAQPMVPLTQTDFWAQGIQFGLELQY